MWTLAWWWMLVALPAPWLVRRFVGSEILDRSAALKVPASSAFASLVGATSGAAGASWRMALMWAVWTLAVLAAARPQFVGEPVALPRSGRDLLLVVDL
jgi:Ca-activated chloride channel family protein